MKGLIEIEVHFPINDTREICSLLFQRGVQLNVHVNVSINSFLCKQLSLDKTYVDKRISTIFLNGQPVDDINKAIMNNNDTLALSGAMPGLIGATLKRDSQLAPLRDSITFKEYRNDIIQDYGLIHLKLFNFISQEVGPLLLKRGVIVDLEDMVYFFAERMSKKPKGSCTIYLDKKKLSLNGLKAIVKSKMKQKVILICVEA